MVWLLFLPVAVYVLAMGVLARHVARRRRVAAPAASVDPLPRIAVLVAARNEEGNLPRCLDALLAQDYPADRIEIYIADDHSTDRTAEVVDHYRVRSGADVSLAAGYADEAEIDVSPAVHYVAVPDARGDLRGKANAIHAAIQASDHEILLITDADCAPPPGWARGLSRYLSHPDVGVACGLTEVDAGYPGAPRRLAEVQALDWTFLLAACSALVEAGRPITAMGNNMAIRRAAYEAVGGYPALPFSVTEDYLLFRTIVARTPWRARFPSDPAARNVTLPLESLGEVYEQRRRWARGGMRAPTWVYGAYSLAHLAHLIPLIVLLVNPAAALIAIALKVGADLTVMQASLRPRRSHLMRSFLGWEAYFFAYMTTLPAVLLLFPRIRWKDRKL
jgi:1,2-diacylglycerol 3-beta-glucosyltransferase